MVLGLNPCLSEALKYVAQVTSQTLLVAASTLSKAAMSRGMNRYALVFYADLLSIFILFPLSFIFERKKRLPQLRFSLLVKFFFLGLCGITLNRTFVNAGIDYSSPTLVSALRNLVPVFTFCSLFYSGLTLIFFPRLSFTRMEKLNFGSSKSQIKIIATLVSIAGALTVTLYKGSPSGSSESFSQSPNLFSTLMATERNWVLGGFLTAISSFCGALWIIAQGSITKEYPAEINIVAFYFLFGTIQCAAISLIVEGNHQQNAWTIRPDIELISVISSALAGSVMPFLVDIWCIRVKGPVFVAMFQPLGIAIAAIMGVIFLGETLHIGTIVGSIIVMIGFYGVMWAKSKELNKKMGDSNKDFLPSSSQKTPLLQNGEIYK